MGKGETMIKIKIKVKEKEIKGKAVLVTKIKTSTFFATKKEKEEAKRIKKVVTDRRLGKSKRKLFNYKEEVEKVGRK
jgi:hypothetical protein